MAFFALVALIWIGIDTDPKQHTLILGMANLLCWVVIGCVAASQGASGADAFGKKQTLETPGSSTPLPDVPQSHPAQKEASAA